MYIMDRIGSCWIFDTAEELWVHGAVRVRKYCATPDGIKPSPENFDEFLSRLDSGEVVVFGHNAVIIWKCYSCVPANECIWHQSAEYTHKMAMAFYKEAAIMGGHIANDRGTIIITNKKLRKHFFGIDDTDTTENTTSDN